MRLSYDGRIEDLLKVAMAHYELLDIHTQEADLEEVFLTSLQRRQGGSLMLANIFTKALRDNWRGVGITVAVLGLMLLFVMAVFKNIDLSFYSQMPSVLRTMLGIPSGAGVGSLAVGELLAAYGAWTIGCAGHRLRFGGPIAGEEASGTIGLLLANPRSRTNLLVSKAYSMIFLMAARNGSGLGSHLSVAGVLGVNLGTLNVGLLSADLRQCPFLRLFGDGDRRGPEAGRCPGHNRGRDVYFHLCSRPHPAYKWMGEPDQDFPLVLFQQQPAPDNGIDWAHVGILFCGILIFGVAAIIGVNRRIEKPQRRS